MLISLLGLWSSASTRECGFKDSTSKAAATELLHGLVSLFVGSQDYCDSTLWFLHLGSWWEVPEYPRPDVPRRQSSVEVTLDSRGVDVRNWRTYANGRGRAPGIFEARKLFAKLKFTSGDFIPVIEFISKIAAVPESRNLLVQVALHIGRGMDRGMWGLLRKGGKTRDFLWRRVED